MHLHNKTLYNCPKTLHHSHNIDSVDAERGWGSLFPLERWLLPGCMWELWC